MKGLKEIDFTDIEGIRVGHAHNLSAATGCTVFISDEGATVGVDVRGGAPGTRETDLLNPVNLVQKIHGVILTGGSAFGLDAAAGVMQYLEEQGIGFDVQVAKVPIVCGAALFDLIIGDPAVRPDKEMGYRASINAGIKSLEQGNVGVGTGATVGKIRGMRRAMKSGLGHHAFQVGALKVGAMVAVNCLGDVIDPQTGTKLAGLLSENLQSFEDTEEVLISSYDELGNLFSGNTTIGVIATNASFTKAQAAKLASMAHNGYGRALRPAHTMFDGDTIFAMSTGAVETDLSAAGALASRAMERAIVSAVINAGALCGLPCSADFKEKWFL